MRIVMTCLIALVLLLSACTKETKDERGEMNIMCYGYQTDEIYDMYARAYTRDNSLPRPHFVTPGASPDSALGDVTQWREMLMKNLLTKSGDIDIFFINSMDPNAYKIIRDHYYVDLSQDEAIAGYWGDLYPEIREWCTDGDEWFGIPYNVHYPMKILTDESMMREIGYTADDIRSIGGLLDFCDTWRDEMASEPAMGFSMSAMNYCINYLFLHYDRATGELNLDTPAFRSILSQCRSLAEKEPIFQGTKGVTTDINSDASPLALSYGTIIPRMHQQYEPVPMPLLDGESDDTKRYAVVYWFIINPYSDNIGRALEYMAFMLEGSVRTHFPSALFQKSGYYRETDEYTQERLDHAGEFIEGAFAGMSFPGYDDVLDICNAYAVDGAKTLDEAVADAQHVLDTVRQEQYIGK